MKEMKKTMMAAIFDVFERMFYVFLEPVNDEYSDYAMAVTIQFGGALKGEVSIFVSERLAKSMVQNLLGLERDEMTEQDIEDSVKEAANMICGNFLGKLDPKKVFDLSIPSFSRRPGKAAQGENVCMLCFDSDSDGFCTTLTLFN